jgi:hypothetical protein
MEIEFFNETKFVKEYCMDITFIYVTLHIL